MDRKIHEVKPDYKRIFKDIIKKKFPEKIDSFQHFFEKEEFSVLDVITLNSLIFDENKSESTKKNQKYRSYDKATILEILEYQKEHHLNNSQLAAKFRLSRNTVAKWRSVFL